MAILGVIGHVLLVLLKILLIILAVVFALILIVLLIPINYEAAAKGDSRQGLMSLCAHAKVSLLLGLVRVNVKLKKGHLRFCVKVLAFALKKGGKNLFGEIEEENAPDAAAPEAAAVERIVPTEAAPVPSETAGTAEENVGSAEEAEHAVKAEPAAEAEPAADTEPAATAPAEPSYVPEGEDFPPPEPLQEPAPEKETLREKLSRKKKRTKEEKKEAAPKEKKRIRSIPEIILDLTDAIGDILAGKDPSGTRGVTGTAESLSDKAAGAMDKLSWGIEQLEEPSHVRTFGRVKGEIFRLLRHYLPREIRAEGTFGTGDPASTGQLLGAIYTFCPLYCEKGDIRVAGDFEEAMAAGRLYLKGHIRLIIVLFSGIRLLLDKNIRKLIKMVLHRK